MRPSLPRSLIPHTFIISTAVPCSLTLEIQERIISHRPRHARPRRQTLCAALFRIFWNKYPCACPLCPVAFHDLSYLIIHNTDHPHMLINIRNTGHNNRPRLSLPAKPTATILGTAIDVSSAPTYPRLPYVPAFHEPSYLTIHNIDHHPTRINIRYTGCNNPSRLCPTPNGTPQSLERLSMSPCLPRSPIPHTFIRSTTVPCSLTLEIQEPITAHAYRWPPNLLLQSSAQLSTCSGFRAFLPSTICHTS